MGEEIPEDIIWKYRPTQLEYFYVVVQEVSDREGTHLSPSFETWNCSAMIQAKVGPTCQMMTNQCFYPICPILAYLRATCPL